MPSAIDRALADVARLATPVERELVHYVLTRYCDRLFTQRGVRAVDSTVESLDFSMNPVALTRRHLREGIVSTQSHCVTVKVDGENFHLVQVAGNLWRLAQRDSVDAVRMQIGKKRERDVILRQSSSSSSAKTPNASVDEASSSTVPTTSCVFLIGRGDSASTNPRVYVVEDNLIEFDLSCVSAAAAAASNMLMLDGELALRRRPSAIGVMSAAAHDARLRRRTMASFAWTVSDNDDDDDDDVSVNASVDVTTTAAANDDFELVYVVHDCLYMRKFQGDGGAQQRLAAAKMLVHGLDGQQRAPLVCRDRRRLDVVYKHHAPPRMAALVAADIERVIVGLNCDGLIVTPLSGGYVVGTNDRLFKLKPTRLQTIDLRVCASSFVATTTANDRISVYMCSSSAPCSRSSPMLECTHADNRHVFARVPRRDFDAAHIDLTPPGNNDTAAAVSYIVEFAPVVRAEDGRVRWCPARIRGDKSRPNARMTIDATLEALRDCVTYDDLFAVLKGD